MNKEVKSLMINNDFYLLRSKKHAVWKHFPTGKIVTTAKTPRSVGNTLLNIQRDIRHEVGRLNGK